MNVIVIYYPDTISEARMQFLAHWLANHPLSPNVVVETRSQAETCYTILSENLEYTFQFQGRFLTDQIEEYAPFGIQKTVDWYHFDWDISNAHSHPDVFDFWFYFLAAYGEQRWPSVFLNQQLCYRDEVHTLIQNNLHHLPICDHNLKAFWKLLGFEIAKRPSKFVMSHDIDHVRRFPNRLKLYRNTIGALIRTKRLSTAKRVWETGIAVLRKLEKDPYDTFENLFVKSNKTQKILYILCTSHVRADGESKDLDLLVNLARKAQRSGYKIGIHPSYTSAIERSDVAAETAKLSALLDQPIRHARQHFLRFQWDKMFSHWKDAGIIYDSSIGFRHHVGFRLGTAFPMQLYDLTQNEISDITEIPLVYMDVAAKREATAQGTSLLSFTTLFFDSISHNSHICINVHNSSFDDLGTDSWMDWATYNHILTKINVK